MMSYKHFTLKEREYLQELLSQNLSYRKIAKILGRAASSISREANLNKAKYKPHKKSNNQFWYSAWRAQNLYIIRRRKSARQALKRGTDEWNFIVDGLRKFWSPECICGMWHELYPERKTLCASTIYRYINLKKFPNITRKKNLRRRGKRIQRKSTNCNTIKPDRIIPEWTDEIKSRSRIGDWEGDTVYGAVGKGYLTTMVDRKSKLLKMRKVLNRTAEATRLAIEESLDGLPVHSISLDNGSEFAEFHKLEENLNTLVYFAEPHKPWQRPLNECTNDIVRFFFPKGCDFTKVSDEDIQRVEDLINNRPRKCLGWKTPLEVFLENFFKFSVALA